MEQLSTKIPILRRGAPCGALLGALSIALAFACYPGSPSSVDEFDTVVTFSVVETDFQGFSTYAMPDSILQREVSLPVSGAYDQLMLDTVAERMADYGYRRIADPNIETPEVVLLIMVTVTEEYRAFNAFPAGGWGWFFGGIGGSWMYPWFGGTNTFTFNKGTVLIDMLDVSQYDPDNDTTPSVWVAALNGVVDQDVFADPSSRVVEAINQAFAQSPYLDTTTP